MPDLNLLRDLGDESALPPSISLLYTSIRRNRLAAAFTVTACAAVVVAVIAVGAQLTGYLDHFRP